MNVAALQKHFSDLSEFLAEAGATRAVLDGLSAVRDGLAPFADYEFADFAEFLKHADEYKRTGVIPIKPPRQKKGGSGRKPSVPKPANLTFDEARIRVRTLYELASAGEVTRQRLDDELAPLLARGALSIDDLKQVAAEADSAGTVKSVSAKAKIVDVIKQAIMKRSGNVERIGQ